MLYPLSYGGRCGRCTPGRGRRSEHEVSRRTPPLRPPARPRSRPSGRPGHETPPVSVRTQSVPGCSGARALALGWRPCNPGPAPAVPHRCVLVCDDTEPIRRLLRINLELAGFERRGGRRRPRGDGPAHRPRACRDPTSSCSTPRWRRTTAGGRSPPSGRTRASTRCPSCSSPGRSSAHDAPEASDAGFDEFISKPFDPDALVDAVSRLAAGGRAPARPPIELRG